MTTNVLILAHDWPVEMIPVDPKTNERLEHSEIVRVEKHRHGTSYIHDGQAILVKEIQE